uniref:NADH-ubiquinone oxidoreductase chain 2 n=1 Tax=Prionoglaris stygia TaxID=1954335 RepID=A0A343QCC2_9NEOP|nr:NADH dehydrogenase subunit 2 [Prionoglaris stygia]ATU07069.1 NADH dehydrogenase subunit 2 [Prionoglaris stygia]
MFNHLNFLFMVMMITGTVITISSNSWIVMWMGLEINLMSFIPLISNKKWSNNTSMKYFLVQALASASLILFILLNSSTLILNSNFIDHSIMFLIMMALMLKIGAAPFHNWVIFIANHILWSYLFILLTWQKIAPLCMLFYCSMNNNMYMFIFLSALVGSIFNLNQNSLKKILTYSSINHLSWIMSTFFISKMMFLIYFSFYMMLNLVIILMFNFMNIFYINQMFNSTMNSKLTILVATSTMMAMGGLPPFLGFLPKWMVIQTLISSSFFFLTYTLILFSLIMLFIYIQIFFSSLMLTTSMTKWTKTNKFNSLYINMYMWIMISSLIMFFMIIN